MESAKRGELIAMIRVGRQRSRSLMEITRGGERLTRQETVEVDRGKSGMLGLNDGLRIAPGTVMKNGSPKTKQTLQESLAR